MYAQLKQSVSALVQREIAAEQSEIFDQHIAPRWHDIAPGFLICAGANRRTHDAKVRRLPIAANNEIAVEMIHRVEMIRFPR